MFLSHPKIYSASSLGLPIHRYHMVNLRVGIDVSHEEYFFVIQLLCILWFLDCLCLSCIF